MGLYCLAGSSNGTGCPPGTFLNVTGGRAVTDCYNCTEGYYCGGYGNPAPTGPCAGGYYCPQAMVTSSPPDYVCPIGEYGRVTCLLGTSHRVVKVCAVSDFSYINAEDGSITQQPS